MLRLPQLSNINQTIAAWGRELRSSGVVTVGRGAAGIPQFNPTTNGYESVELKDCGADWADFTPIIANGSGGAISNQVVRLARWTQIGRTIYGKLNFDFKTPAAPSGDVVVLMPLKIKMFVDIVKIGDGIADGTGLVRKKVTMFSDPASAQGDPVRCTVYTGDTWPASTDLRVYLDFMAEAYYG